MTRDVRMHVTVVLVAAMLAAAGMAAAASRSGAPRACTNWVHTTSPNAGTGDNNLYGVAATSASDAWAVGESFFGVSTKTLVEHWNGKSWRIVKSPNAGTGDLLKAVYAVSPANVWAAGSYFNGAAGRTLIEHWNGKAWSAVTSPDLGAGSNEITSIRGTSAHDIWAAGDAVTSYPVTKTVILHWNGHRWRMVSSPSVPAEPNLLTGVRPLSPAEAWAVGRQVESSTPRTLILHWSGRHWRIVPSPDAGASTNVLTGVRAPSATDARAVGSYYNGTADRTLVLLYARSMRRLSGASAWPRE